MRLYLVSRRNEPSWFQSGLCQKLREAIKLRNEMNGRNPDHDYQIYCIPAQLIEPGEDGKYRIGV